MTEQLHFPFSLSCVGGGNGNPLQCSCLENPRDGGAWWAAVFRVAQSRTRLKWQHSIYESDFLVCIFLEIRSFHPSCQILAHSINNHFCKVIFLYFIPVCSNIFSLFFLIYLCLPVFQDIFWLKSNFLFYYFSPRVFISPFNLIVIQL